MTYSPICVNPWKRGTFCIVQPREIYLYLPKELFILFKNAFWVINNHYHGTGHFDLKYFKGCSLSKKPKFGVMFFTFLIDPDLTSGGPSVSEKCSQFFMRVQKTIHQSPWKIFFCKFPGELSMQIQSRKTHLFQKPLLLNGLEFQ